MLQQKKDGIMRVQGYTEMCGWRSITGKTTYILFPMSMPMENLLLLRNLPMGLKIGCMTETENL